MTTPGKLRAYLDKIRVKAALKRKQRQKFNKAKKQRRARTGR